LKNFINDQLDFQVWSDLYPADPSAGSLVQQY
jgi:hypothetical protein